MTQHLHKPLAKSASTSFLTVLAVLFLSLLNNKVTASTCTWLGDTDSNWSEPSNWSPIGVPGVNDTVEFSGILLTLDVPVTVKAFFMTGGIIDGNNDLTITGTFNWSGGSLAGTGKLTVQGYLDIFGATTKTISGKNLVLEGNGTWSNGNISVSATKEFRIESSANLEITHTATQFMGNSSTGAIKVLGTITKNSSSTTQFRGILQDSGSILVNAGVMESSISGNCTVTGNLTVASGATLKFPTGTQNFNDGSSITGNGILWLSGATVNAQAGSTLNIALQITNGTFNNDSNISLKSMSLTTGNFVGTGSATVDDDLDWSVGKIQISGNLTVNDSMFITGTSAKSLLSGTLTVGKFASWTNGNINIGTGATLMVNTGAVFSIDLAADRILGSSADGFINVEGVMQKTTLSKATFNGTLSILAGGKLDVLFGIMEAGASSKGEHAGLLTVAANAMLNFANGAPHNFNNGASVDGDGTLKVSGGTVFFNAGSALTTDLVITAGYLIDEQSITPASFFQSGGDFDGTGNTLVTGNATWSYGSMSGTSTFTVNGTMTFPADSLKSLDARELILRGNGFWQGGDFNLSSSATITVAASSKLNLDHAADATMSGDGNFNIVGSISKNDETAITTFDGVNVTNGGTIMGTGILSFTTITNNGAYAPGFSPGTLYVNSFDNSNGEYNVEIQSTAGSGTGHDNITVNGNATLGGVLNVTLLSGFVPAVGNTFEILTATTVTGTFGTLNLPTLPIDRYWLVDYAAGSVTLEVLEIVLPVELVDFQATANNGLVTLKWETASEQNNQGFEVQRSVDGLFWQKTAFVNGHGTTNSPNRYTANDRPNAVGALYYRLRQIDFNGKESFSKIEEINMAGHDSQGEIASVYPNPLNAGPLRISLNKGMEGMVSYHVCDNAGRTVLQGKFEAETGIYEVKKHDLPRGVCHLTLTAGSFTQTHILVVE